jgi:mRNA-degrading endonuclease RelE of RelBE toxin-antitoxin system
MTPKKSNSQANPYKVWMKPAVHNTRDQLPGYIRQQIKRIVDELRNEARPAQSKPLVLSDTIQIEWEVRRIRIDAWRIVYAISETWQEVAVLTIQKRPPYDYEDLEELLAGL